MKATFLKCHILMFFPVLECKKRKRRSHGKRKNGNIKRKICTEKRLNTSLKDLSLALTNHGRHGLFSFLSSLAISVLCNLELEANKLYDRANKLYKAALLTRCYVQHFLSPYIDSEVNHKQHFIKIPFVNKGFEFIAGHVITGNLNVIPDASVCNIISKGPKYIFPSNIDFSKCRREIAASLNAFSNRWCKRENVEPDALKEWKNIFKIIDTRISFYSRNTHLLSPKPKSSFRHLKRGIQDVHMNYVLVPAEKAANNVVVV